MEPLFEPGRINGLTLKNRSVRSATWEGMAAEEGSVTAPLIDLYCALADGGVGLIITGHSYVHPSGKHSPRQLGSYSDDLIPGLQQLTRVVHDRDGRIVLQLNYGGAYLSRARVGQMIPEDIRAVGAAFARAAWRAQEAGFDGVQILAAHGFFLSQLLCPRYNPRTDEFGGSIENRARALVEAVGAVRGQVGPEYPLLVKINSRDLIEDGLQLEESLQVGRWLEAAGVDALEISGGLLNGPNLLQDKNTGGEDLPFFRNEARAFKPQLQIPVILVGGIRSFTTAQRLLSEGTADFIALCRPFIREPELINRWQRGDRQKAACLSCNNCVEQLKQGSGLACRPLEPQKKETFFAQKTESLPAGPPFPSTISYQVSFGLEEWDGNFLPVIKIQMVRDGQILNAGLSFPAGTDAFEKIRQLVKHIV
jgi:2,4-dienoyl-CoA reductase-like NADH-dependent reductase (Old Yellow Enzyme family)